MLAVVYIRVSGAIALFDLLVRQVVVREGEVLVEARVQAAAGVSRSGTAPHVFDPRNPGAVDEIVHLGDYWDESKLRSRKQEIIAANRRVARHFATAYSSLRVAKIAREEEKSCRSEGIRIERLNQLAGDLIRQVFGKEIPCGNGAPKDRHLFASALTPGGIVHHLPTILEVERLFVLKGEPGAGKERVLQELAGFAYRCGFRFEVYHCAFDPAQIDLLLLPEQRTAVLNLFPELDFVPTSLPGLNLYREYDFDFCLDPDSINACREELREAREVFARSLARAIAYIKKAKEVHDEMEQFYVEAMDFEGVERRRQEILARILAFAP
ncbi:MAG: hypothetical protein HPY58_12185 [Firmicutes bacterium]|nr:hypothetical protein [Bacillota bacterium]